MDENPYEPPRSTSERPAESMMRKRRTGRAVLSFFLGVFWIVLMAAVFFTPGVDVHPARRESEVVWVVFFTVASSPAIALFRWGKRALH